MLCVCAVVHVERSAAAATHDDPRPRPSRNELQLGDPENLARSTSSRMPSRGAHAASMDSIQLAGSFVLDVGLVEVGFDGSGAESVRGEGQYGR